MCSAYLISYHGGYRYPFIVYMSPITSRILFFALGIILGRSERNYRIASLVVGVMFTLVLQIAESLYQKSIGVSSPYDCTKPSGFIYFAIFIVLIFSKQMELWYVSHRIRFIEYIGEISFALYLGHCYLILALNASDYTIPFAIKWFAVLLLSIVCVSLLRKIIINKTIRSIIGL